MRLIASLIAIAVLPALPARAQLHSNGSQLWYQGLTGVPGPPGESHRLGAAVAAADFDGDGRSDLAMGAPHDDVQGLLTAGAVRVLYGAAEGLTSSGSQYWYEGKGQMPGTVTQGASFGASLAAGDFNGDGRSDLAVGASAKAINGAVRAVGPFARGCRRRE